MSLTSSLTQARHIIEAQLHLLWSAKPPSHQIAPIMLWGAPGVGKSQLVRELCNVMGIEFIDIRLSQMEPVDMRGIPVPNGDAVKWLVASTWPRDPTSRGILFFDELSAADRSLQAAAYELLLDRRLGDLYQLPEGWLVMGAGNRSEDRAVSVPMSSALANRFLHLELEADIEAWGHYAVAKGLHPEVIAFLRFKPEYLLVCEDNAQRGWPSPRSWERVSTLLLAELELDEGTLRVMVHGLVGQAACTELMAFRHWAKQGLDVPAMLRGEKPISIPDRIDQQLAFCAAIVHYLWQGDEAMLEDRLAVFFKVGLQLGSDLATLLLMDALRVDDGTESDSRAEQIFAHADFPLWLERHGVSMEGNTKTLDTGLPEGPFEITSLYSLSQETIKQMRAAQGGHC